MTLDEAIKRAEEIAEENQAIVDACDYYGDNMAKCEQCASEYRQLVEWLKELKALKENDDVKDVFKGCRTCKYVSLEPDEFPCDRCCHRYINQYVYDDKREVNADDCSKHS